MASVGKWSEPEQIDVVRTFHDRVRALIAARLDQLPGSRADKVFARQFELVGADDLAAIERDVLDSGHRFTPSAQVSAREAPDKYLPLSERLDADADAYADDTGRPVVGQGANVSRHDGNVTGVARLVRTLEDVADLMAEGVPEGTIAVIDDSGGTLTAPVLEDFVAIICCGGTTRSHLGILSREYGLPCLMGVTLTGLGDGDRVEVEFTAPAATAEDYENGTVPQARVWKL